MIRNMKFWDEQSQRIGEQLENLVIPMPAEDDTKEQLQKKDEFRREAVVLLRTFLAARENAQRCAVDAAPFVHPKLQSISINKQTTKTTIKMTIPAPADDKERTYRGDRTVVPFRVAEG